MEENEEALGVELEVEAKTHQSRWNNCENNRRLGNDDNKQPGNRSKGGKDTVNGDNGKTSAKNICSKPGHKHEWRDCPENKFSGNFKGDDKKGCGKDGENHSIVQKNKSPTVVRFENPGDFDISDDKSVSYQKPEHMMIVSPAQEDNIQ